MNFQRLLLLSLLFQLYFRSVCSLDVFPDNDLWKPKLAKGEKTYTTTRLPYTEAYLRQWSMHYMNHQMYYTVFGGWDLSKFQQWKIVHNWSFLWVYLPCYLYIITIYPDARLPFTVVTNAYKWSGWYFSVFIINLRNVTFFFLLNANGSWPNLFP